jgi:hypothetical protein
VIESVGGVWRLGGGRYVEKSGSPSFLFLFSVQLFASFLVTAVLSPALAHPTHPRPRM